MHESSYRAHKKSPGMKAYMNVHPPTPFLCMHAPELLGKMPRGQGEREKERQRERRLFSLSQGTGKVGKEPNAGNKCLVLSAHVLENLQSPPTPLHRSIHPP